DLQRAAERSRARRRARGGGRRVALKAGVQSVVLVDDIRDADWWWVCGFETMKRFACCLLVADLEKRGRGSLGTKSHCYGGEGRMCHLSKMLRFDVARRGSAVVRGRRISRISLLYHSTSRTGAFSHSRLRNRDLKAERGTNAAWHFKTTASRAHPRARVCSRDSRWACVHDQHNRVR
ncbi:unnamed protein product, partial [Hapterophycus canaliculatus]